jgi:tetratricopeptide (TPR) repeat protein
MSNLASTYEALGELEKAQSLRKETLELRKARLGDGHPDTVQSLSDLAKGYSTMGKPEQALPLFQEAAAGVEKLEFAHRHAGQIILGLCNCHSHERLKQYDQAEVWLRKWLAVTKAQYGPGSVKYAGALAGLGSNLLQQKKHADAETNLRECLAIYQKEQPVAWGTFRIRILLGTALLGQKRYAEAEPLLVQCYWGMKKKVGKVPCQEGLSPLIDALEQLVQLYDAWNRPQEAAKWRKELARTKALPPPPARPKPH